MEGKKKQGRGEEGKKNADSNTEKQDTDWGNIGNMFDSSANAKGKPQQKRNTVKKQSDKVSIFELIWFCFSSLRDIYKLFN